MIVPRSLLGRTEPLGEFPLPAVLRVCAKVGQSVGTRTQLVLQSDWGFANPSKISSLKRGFDASI